AWAQEQMLGTERYCVAVVVIRAMNNFITFHNDPKVGYKIIIP
ncbi:MAG: hypothetical protein ACI81F_001028, partial [Thalassolituus oleivorans]